MLAGAALMRGAIMAALLAPLIGRAIEHCRPRAVAVTGTLVFATGAAVLASRTSTAMDHAGALLPGIIITGASIGLTISSLGAAAVSDLLQARFAAGSAVPRACARSALSWSLSPPALLASRRTRTGPWQTSTLHGGS